MMSIVIGLITLSDHRKIFQVVPDDVKHMLNEWALRGLIVISLVSQITLSQLGNARKYNPRTRVRMALWFAYFLALAVASSALDSITAFVLEDNELSLRHFVEIVFQFVVALYIFLLSQPGCSELPKLSVLVYLAGFIKCFERIKALRLAKTENLHAWDSSQSYFRHLKSSNAFRVVEIELGFSFDMLYTKANVVYTFNGLLLRLTSISALILVPAGFHYLCTIDDYHTIDLVITYLLVGTTLIIDIFAVITMLRSDWTDHWLIRKNLTRQILILPFLKQPNKQRWSGSMAQFDLLSVALDERPASFAKTPIFSKIDKFHEYMVVNTNLKELCTNKDVGNQDGSDIDICRMESKHISDYLMYLLVTYPVMLPIGIGMIRYRDTCADANRYFKENGLVTQKVEACLNLLEVDSLEVLPSKVKGDQCKSVLFDGCRLALTLKKMEKERMDRNLSLRCYSLQRISPPAATSERW
ncbi:hypothetical protein Tco_1097200 [Tanacetum coccineum]